MDFSHFATPPSAAPRKDTDHAVAGPIYAQVHALRHNHSRSASRSRGPEVACDRPDSDSTVRAEGSSSSVVSVGDYLEIKIALNDTIARERELANTVQTMKCDLDRLQVQVGCLIFSTWFFLGFQR